MDNKINKVVLDYNSKYKINIPESIQIFFKGLNKRVNEEKTNTPGRIPNMYVDVLFSRRWRGISQSLSVGCAVIYLPKCTVEIRRKKKSIFTVEKSDKPYLAR